jgi:hypothetical protein
MKKDSRTYLTHRAERPVPYFPWTRFFDRRNGTRDGRADLLAAVLAGERSGALGESGHACLTPYLGGINSHVMTQIERVRLMAETDLEAALKEQKALQQQLVHASESLAKADKDLDNKPQAAPADYVSAYLAKCSSVEQLQPEAVRTRRAHEAWADERAQILAAEQSAARRVEQLQNRLAELDGIISTRRAIAATRARRLHQHALRRHRTYERRLVLRHPNGTHLVQLLNVTRPQPPAWIEAWAASGDSVSAL